MRFLSLLLLAAAFLFAALPVFAQPSVICTGLPGCGGAPVFDVLFASTLPAAIQLLINIAAAAAVIFIVVAGGQLMFATGDEAQVTQGRWAILYALLGLGLALGSQSLVEFVATEYWGQLAPDFLFGGVLPSVVRVALLLFNATFMLVIMFAGIRMALTSGKPDEFQKALSTIKWSVGGAITVNGARALVQALLLLGL
jgi:type IV secretory pathway VirB2 component (pilin)